MVRACMRACVCVLSKHDIPASICLVHQYLRGIRTLFQGIYRGSSKKSEKICVARWDYATHKSSFSELSYLAFSQNSLSNSPRFASLAYSYFVVYISNHIKMTDKFGNLSVIFIWLLM